ncbi:uncharacterized protein LOC110447630 isoform X2 [Mizuhopecten yessoensis]|uniref:uncharacterized protein LOC110447630 isoform X2 n=1 Tax=Mizuhopecten yessoensis TaxID=6573 RepID=UPI000B459E12|nr:uncharacterized protein LOC110447630 isoform X2 [Mizuhopecten yessoensis]
MPLDKPTKILYGRLINKDRPILQKKPRYDNSPLDLEVEGLKQRIDCNIKRHMDIRYEIRTEIDKLRQENMDIAANLHRTDETFYLHQDFNEEVHRLRSMNVRLKSMLCLQDVKSIEAYGPTKSRSAYPKYAEQRKSHNYTTTSHDSGHATRADISGKSSDLFARIDQLEAEMRNFLVENPLPKRNESYQQKHVSDVDIHCSTEGITNNIRGLSINDKPIFVPTKDVQPQTRLQECDRTKGCHANTDGFRCKCQVTHSETASYHHVVGPHAKSNFRIKDESFACDKTNTNMKLSRSKCKNVVFNDIDMPIMNSHWSTDASALSDDRDVNMNSFRSEDRHVLFGNRDMITINPRSTGKGAIPQDGYINMHYRSKDECVLSDDKDINMNSSRKLESMLVMVHPKRSQSGTIVGFDIAENFEVKPTDDFKSLHHENVISADYEPTQPVRQNGVSNLVSNYVVDASITVEDVEIRDIYKNASNDSDSEQSTSSSDMTLKFATPFKIVSSRHIRPRDVPRLNLGDLVSESDVNLVKVTKEAIADLLSDQDQNSDVSYIDLSDGNGCQHMENENMSAADVQHHQGCYSEENFFRGDSADDPLTSTNDNKAPAPELEESTKHSLEEHSPFERTKMCDKSTRSNKLNLSIKLSSSVSQTNLDEDVHQMSVRDVDGTDINTDKSVQVMPTDDEEERYGYYVELCNTSMRLTSIIKDMCASRSIPNKQEFPQHPNTSDEPRLPALGVSRNDDSDNNALHVPIKHEPADQLVRPKTIPKQSGANLSSPSYAEDVQLDKNNFPWMFPNDGEQYDNVNTESEETCTIPVTMPTCTMDSARSDVSCIDLSLHEETPNLGSTRREHAVKTCFTSNESPRCGVEENVTNRTEISVDVMDTGRLIVPSELALSCKRRQLLSTSLSESHEDIVRLLNWTNASNYVGAWKDPEHSITDDENSVQEILNSPESMVGSSQRKQLWQPCLLSEYMPKDGEQTKPYYGHENNGKESARSGYDLDSDISCIDLSEEVASISSAQNGPEVKEFLSHEGDEMNTQDVSYRDVSPRWSTSETSSNEESCSSYFTASEDDSVHDGLASPDSLVGYARRDKIWEEDFVANYMRMSSKEQNNKEEAERLIAQSNEDIDSIHAIRIPILLAEADEHTSKDLLISDHEARVIFEAMNSARSDVSCIELIEEEPTLSDIREGHVVKEFLMCKEDNPIPTESGNDILEFGRWAVPIKHTTYELPASEPSSDDQVVISDIDNDDGGSDGTCNDVTSVQAFSDADFCVFDMDDPDPCFAKQNMIEQCDLRLPGEQVQTSICLPFHDTDLHLEIGMNEYVVPRMSDVKKHGPRVTFSVLRELNSKLEKVKQELMESSGMSKWLTL